MEQLVKREFYKTVNQTLMHVEILLRQRQIDNDLGGEDSNLVLYSLDELQDIFNQIRREIKKEIGL